MEVTSAHTGSVSNARIPPTKGIVAAARMKRYTASSAASLCPRTVRNSLRNSTIQYILYYILATFTPRTHLRGTSQPPDVNSTLPAGWAHTAPMQLLMAENITSTPLSAVDTTATTTHAGSHRCKIYRPYIYICIAYCSA